MQNERSQQKNRDVAWKILRAKLYEAEEKKRAAARDAAEATKKDIDFGSQIRSYVLQPYRMVKDLRTGVETGKVDDVLDGDIEGVHPAVPPRRAQVGSGRRGLAPLDCRPFAPFARISP